MPPTSSRLGPWPLFPSTGSLYRRRTTLQPKLRQPSKLQRRPRLPQSRRTLASTHQAPNIAVFRGVLLCEFADSVFLVSRLVLPRGTLCFSCFTFFETSLLFIKGKIVCRLTCNLNPSPPGGSADKVYLALLFSHMVCSSFLLMFPVSLVFSVSFQRPVGLWADRW